MSKRKIFIPKQTIPVAGGQQFGTKALIQWAINVDSRFNSNAAGIRASMRIDLAIEQIGNRPPAKPDDPALDEPQLVLREEDYQLLLAAVTDPRPLGDSQGYPVFPGRLIDPFIKSIEDAVVVDT